MAALCFQLIEGTVRSLFHDDPGIIYLLLIIFHLNYTLIHQVEMNELNQYYCYVRFL